VQGIERTLAKHSGTSRRTRSRASLYLQRIGTWSSLDELALELDDVAEAFEPSLHQR
jgi:hypothetical protein